MLPLLFFISSFLHPFFVSVIEAEYFKKENIVGISCKIFTDDFENVLKNSSGQPVDIINGDKNANRQKMTAFFPKHLKVKVNNKTLNYEVIGYEIEKDAAFVFLEIKNSGDPKKFEIETDLLYDLDKSQVNLVHFIKNGERKTQRLTHPNTSAVFQ